MTTQQLLNLKILENISVSTFCIFFNCSIPTLVWTELWYRILWKLSFCMIESSYFNSILTERRKIQPWDPEKIEYSLPRLIFFSDCQTFANSTPEEKNLSTAALVSVSTISNLVFVDSFKFSTQYTRPWIQQNFGNIIFWDLSFCIIKPSYFNSILTERCRNLTKRCWKILK